MMVIVEQLLEWWLAGETEVLRENLPQCYYVRHKSHMTWSGLEPAAAAVGSQRLTAWAMARPEDTGEELQMTPLLVMIKKGREIG
jgi:hypothetical protein